MTAEPRAIEAAARAEERQEAVREIRERLNAASWAKQPLDFNAILDDVARHDPAVQMDSAWDRFEDYSAFDPAVQPEEPSDGE